MNLVYVTEARFIKSTDGLIYGEGASSADLWKRFLQHFSHIYVIARVKQEAENTVPLGHVSSFENVTFIELPYYVGPLDYLKKNRLLKVAIKEKCIIPNAAYLCRVPGNVSNLIIKELIKNNIKYNVEVVGDAWEVFSSGSIQHPLRIFFKYKGYYDLKKNVANAMAAIYVTKDTLQKRYPVSEKAYQINASDVNISINPDFNESKKHAVKEYFEIISVGSLEQMYKAPDVLLKAIAILKNKSVLCNLTWLGEGKFMEKMKQLAEELGLSENVNFLGNVSLNKVHKNLQKADLFVLVSRTEGMPRAIIEAMSHGLPCIGSNVGGIPELLEKEVIVEKNNPEMLADLIGKFISDSSFYNQQAKRNLMEAKQYDIEVLENKRRDFYQHIIQNKS